MIGYEKWDDRYRNHPLEDLPWELGRPRKILIDMVESGLINKGNALDICCGAGTNALYLAKNGFNVTGIDISPTALAYGKEKVEKERIPVAFMEENYLNLPFEREKFDFVFDLGCFHHVKIHDRRTFIKQVTRVLKRGGSYLMVAFSYKNGPAWNHFTEQELSKYFSTDFKIKIIKHFPSIEGDGVTRYFYAFLMEKR